MSATGDPTRVGLVGLGSMGRPIARKLLAAGYAVLGYDLSPHAVSQAVVDGIVPAESPSALAAQCDLILTMVWDDLALRKVVFARDGILAGHDLPSCLIDLSTTSATVALEVGRAVAGRGAAFLDCAVIGGGVAAVRAGTSPMVLAGDREVCRAYASVLEAFGSCTYVGALGNAKIVKIINNFLVGIVTAANAEASSLGVAMGLDVADQVRWLQSGPGGARVLASYMGRYVADGTYGEGLIGHDLMAKDLRLAAELADSLPCPATYPRFGEQMYREFGLAMGADRPFPSAFEYFRRGRMDASPPRRGSCSTQADTQGANS